MGKAKEELTKLPPEWGGNCIPLWTAYRRKRTGSIVILLLLLLLFLFLFVVVVVVVCCLFGISLPPCHKTQDKLEQGKTASHCHWMGAKAHQLNHHSQQTLTLTPYIYINIYIYVYIYIYIPYLLFAISTYMC